MEDSSAVGPSAQSFMEMKECLDDITSKLRPLIEDVSDKDSLSFLLLPFFGPHGNENHRDDNQPL